MKKYLLLALCCLPFAAQAVVLNKSTSADLTVDYTYFSIDADSTVHLETLNGMFDPEMYLFFDDGSLDAGDYIADNDDGGTPALSWYNALLDVFLSAGNYVVAVSDFGFGIDDAVSGSNPGETYGTYDLLITAGNANVTVGERVTVPAPATLGLLGLGLLGLAAARRRQSRR